LQLRCRHRCGRDPKRKRRLRLERGANRQNFLEPRARNAQRSALTRVQNLNTRRRKQSCWSDRKSALIRRHLITRLVRSFKTLEVSHIGHNYQDEVRYDSYLPHILIVDDHECVRKGLCNSIKIAEPAWQLSEAASGKEALEVVREVEPEIVVVDIVMNDMNGFEAAHQIRQINPNAKIVFISSQYRIHDASGMPRLLGDGAFVQKAEASSVLLPTIKRLLNIRL
jgi:CheY-like chemotaxis protein